MSDDNTTNANAAAAANPEPTTTVTATEAAVEGAQEPFRSAYEDNKDSSPALPVTHDHAVGLSVPENTQVTVSNEAEPSDADTTHQATAEQVEGQE